MDVRLPNGHVVRGVPEGTPKETIKQKALAAGLATHMDFGIAEYGSPTRGAFDNFAAGAGKAVTDIGRGIKDFAIDALGGNEVKAENEAAIQASRSTDAPLMSSGAGIAGNIAGNVAAGLLAAPVPGVNSVAGAAALGGAMGAAQPTIGDESRTGNAAMGAGGGAAGNILGRGLARVISPKASAADAPVKGLLQQGVKPTPGQALGGSMKRIEESAKSLPVVGDFIRSGEREAFEGWNKAMGNKVLSHIGKEVPKTVKPGREMITHLGDEVSKAYDDILPKLDAVADDEFLNEIGKLGQMVNDLPDGGSQFAKLVDRHVLKRMAPNGGLTGETVQEIDSQLGKMVRQYKKQGGDAGRLGDALGEVQESLRNMLSRNNPASKEYAAVRRAAAELMRIERASGMQGAQDGIFTPAQLKNAAKAMDSSARKRAFSRGDALLQPEAEAAQAILGNTIPDSGTPGRLMSNGLLMGGLGYLEPTALMGLLGTGAVYGTNAGRAGLLGAATKRPESAASMAALIRRAAGPAGAAALLPSQ